MSPESLRVGEGVVLSGAKVPPSRPFGAPSPAASHAGEGRTGKGAGKRDSWVGGNEVPPSRPFGAPSPAASHAGEGVGGT